MQYKVRLARYVLFISLLVSVNRSCYLTSVSLPRMHWHPSPYICLALWSVILRCVILLDTYDQTMKRARCGHGRLFDWVPNILGQARMHRLPRSVL